MSTSTRSLLEQQAAIRARCGAERDAAARHVSALVLATAGIDRGLARAGRWASHPAVVAAGVAILVLMGRAKPMRTLGTIAGVLPTVLRMAGITRTDRRRQGETGNAG